MSVPVNLYIDFMSQPSRAVLAYCICNNIPHVIKETRLMERANKTPEYKKISPSGKVPGMEHNGFTAFESHTILRYLSTLPEAKESWYPSDIKLRTRVDEYLDWHHTSIRFHSGAQVFYGVFAKNMGMDIKEGPNLKFHAKMLEAGFKLINDFFLANSDFINGFNNPTLADLSAYCEIIGMRLVNYDFSKYPKLDSWLKRMEQIEGLKEAHVKYNKVVKMLMERAKL